MALYLGVDLGSTRIKAAAVDEGHAPVSFGEYTWQSRCENGVWTYDLAEAWRGLRGAVGGIGNRSDIAAAGISAMMHGYLAFDEEWRLLTPFRTWQNTSTAQAAGELTKLFGFNIPQRWSIAHLYQAVLNGEEHVGKIAHITTLAGYVHYMLTGVNAVGIGEASGMFPVSCGELDYDRGMLEKFNGLLSQRGLPWRLPDLLPKVLTAGEQAGCLTPQGAELLEGLLPVGLPFAPPEGDAGTGMTATNSVAVGTGNVSAGTSIFSMAVLERPLKKVHEEIDIVATPTGRPVAMVHCNNCTGDSNAWVSVLREAAQLLGADTSAEDVYSKLYEKSLEGDPDCGGVTVCNYLSGESIVRLETGRPIVTRTPDSKFTLANFFRACLYSALVTLKIGMDILAEEGVELKVLNGHGGLFKTPLVGQRYTAAACNVPVACMETAGEGGPYGMALLAAYLVKKNQGEGLEDYLSSRVFANAKTAALAPDPADTEGFNRYTENFKRLLEVERTTIVNSTFEN